jgi:hypothetical protein
MIRKDLPDDSVLLFWTDYLAAGEVPFSYQVAGGLSTLGALLRRSRWVDQVDWMVYPNQSILFIGPSGIGKDTIINRCSSILTALEVESRVPTIGGCTMELIHARLETLSKPAAAYIPAPEITAFFGKSDYQANMLTGITNLLSNGERVDISTKGSWMSRGGPSLILQPTITMHAGSTVEWLHKGMPDGTLEGGFMGRFLICCEELDPTRRQMPLLKRDRTRDDITSIKGSLEVWREFLRELTVRCQRTPREMILLPEAEDLYANWYYNRFRLFSRAVQPYANRSRDMVLRLGMLMALSRGHDRWIEDVDIGFAIQVIGELAARIDAVVLPPSIEAQVAMKILEMLPATMGEVYMQMGLRFSIPKQIDPALDLLRRTGKIRMDGKVVRKEGDE